MSDSLQDTMIDYYRTVLGRDASIIDLEREFFILGLGDGIYSRTWADAARDYFIAWNGSNPAGSLADEAFLYYSSLSGLTPVEDYTITDHMYQVFAVNGGPNLQPPITDNLEAYYDAEAIDGFRVNGQVSKNLLTVNQASVETDTVGLTNILFTTVARSTAQSTDGSASLAATVTTATTPSWGTPGGTSGIPVTPGRTYTATADHFIAAGAGREIQTKLYWYKSDGTEATGIYSGSATQVLTAGVWTKGLSVTAVAPVDAAFANVRIVALVGSAISDVFYTDRLGLWEGTSTDWVLPGKLHNVNLLSYNQATVEYDTTGFVAGSNANAVAKSTAQSASGLACITWGAVGAGSCILYCSNPIASQGVSNIVPGKTYTAVASFRAAALAAPCYVGIDFYTADNVYISSGAGSSVTSTTVGWTKGSVSRVAPATAARASVYVYYTAAGAVHTHYADEIGFWEGSVTTWVPPYQGTTELSDADSVSFWRDLSGKNRHAIQNTAVRQPKFRKANPTSAVSKNLLTYNQASVETDGTGISGFGTGTVIRTTAQALDGIACAQITATATSITVGQLNTAGNRTDNIVPGRTYTAIAYSRAATTGQQFRVVITFQNAAGSFISDHTGVYTTNSTTGWTPHIVSAVAPSNAASAYITLRSVSAIIAQVYYGDCFGLWEGDSQNWVAPGLPFKNMLTYNQASVETDTTGLAARDAAPTIARSTAQSVHGSASLLVTATAASTSAWGTLSGVSGVPIVEGTTYTATVKKRAVGTSRVCFVYLMWYNLAGSLVSSINASLGTVTSGAWVTGSVTGVAPAGAAYAVVAGTMVSPSIADAIYVDCIGLTEGLNTVWQAPVLNPNNKPCLESNGTIDGQRLTTASFGIDPRNTTIYIIFNSLGIIPSGGSHRRIISMEGSSPVLAVLLGLSTNSLYASLGASVPSCVGATPLTNATIVTVYGTSTESTIKRNAETPVVNTTDPTGPISSSPLGILGNSSGNETVLATISAVLIYSSVHSAAQRESIERWLGGRFGVTVA